MNATEFSLALKGREFEALGEALADDVVLVSPISGSFRFQGRDDVLDLLRNVRAVFDDFEYVESLDGDGCEAIRYRARVGKQPLEGIDLMRRDRTGAIRELTVFVRPLPAAAALLTALGPRVARPHGRWRAVLVGFLTRPLAFITRATDRPGARLAGQTLD